MGRQNHQYIRTCDWFTNQNSPPGIGHGPMNRIYFARELVNASFTDVVSPNADTLYGIAWLNLKNDPIVFKVPPISNRYYTFEFLDAYTNDYTYVGTRATGSSGDTYLITGPDWNGLVPSGMTQIKSPTNLVWIINRIFVHGAADAPNVHAIQDKIGLLPLTVFEGKTAHPIAQQSQPASSKQTPIPPQPALIPTIGIKVYDEVYSTACRLND
jgi:hypothetical protein